MLREITLCWHPAPCRSAQVAEEGRKTVPVTLRSSILGVCKAAALRLASPRATASTPHPTSSSGTGSSRYLSSPSSPLPNGLGKLAPSPWVFSLSAWGTARWSLSTTLLLRGPEGWGVVGRETCWTIPTPWMCSGVGSKSAQVMQGVRGKAQQEQIHVLPGTGVSPHQFFFANIA